MDRWAASIPDEVISAGVSGSPAQTMWLRSSGGLRPGTRRTKMAWMLSRSAAAAASFGSMYAGARGKSPTRTYPMARRATDAAGGFVGD